MRSILFASLLLVGGSAFALAPPHDQSNNISCANCHSPHATMGGAIAVYGAEQEALCKSCHNPTGQASAMSDVAMHAVNAGALVLDCGSCHDPHGPQTSTDPHSGGATAPNLSLFRSDLTGAVSGALTPAVFQKRPDQFAFGASAAPWDGACQACHSATNHHTRDGSADHVHGLGAGCTGCHAHKAGFLPSHCTDCHSQPQDNGDGIPAGGRRAIVGEFPSGVVHAHLKGTAVSDDDCLVCHGLSKHQSGTIELVDPDGKANYFFVKAADLTKDPDVSNFCMNCHDADGATRLTTPMNPFGNGYAPPNVAAKFAGTLQWKEWYGGDYCFGAEGTNRGVNSHHDVSDADQAFSGAKIECLNCHSAHASGSTQKIADPSAPTTAWTGTVSAFCIKCHAGGTPANPGMPADVKAPTATINLCTAASPCPTISSTLRPMDSCDYMQSPWWVSYTYPHSAHGGSSKRGWTGYSGAPAYDMACDVCHDPHGSATTDNPAGNPYMIRDVVDGTGFVDDGAREAVWLGPPWNTFGGVRAVKIDVIPDTVNGGTVTWAGPAGFCNLCHSKWQDAYTFVHPGPTNPEGCTACQTCHGHGQDFGEYDWGSYTNSDALMCQ